MSGSLMVIYKKKNFKIYDAGKGYIVHNTKLNFPDHHTHINNFHTCLRSHRREGPGAGG